MPNLGVLLRDEIRRLARKEVKAVAGGTKQAVAQCRRDIGELKRLLHEQQAKIDRLAAEFQAGSSPPAAEETSPATVRFSARSVRAQRKRLGLSAEGYGRLVGVSALTIFNWEHGNSHPRKTQLAALVALRGIGKREATKRLAEAEPPHEPPQS